MRSIYFVNLDKLEQQRILALNEICDMPPFQQRLCGETFTTRSASEYVAELQKKDDERAEYRKSWRRRPFPKRTYRRHAQQQCALLSKLPAEIVAMCLRMYNNPGGAGATTSGGTESIIMSVKTHREWAKAVKGITEPEMCVNYVPRFYG